MTQASKIVPSIIGGVSQQPAAVRFPGQVTECDNTWVSLIDGATKRPPTEHVAKLATTLPANTAFHVMNREGVDYIIAILPGQTAFADGGLLVFDTNGVQVPVVDELLTSSKLSAHYLGDSPGNYLPDWEQPGLLGNWATSAPDLGGVVVSAEPAPLTGFNPAVEMWDAAAAGDGVFVNEARGLLGAGSVIYSVYAKKKDGMQRFRLTMLTGETGSVKVHSAEFTWTGTVLGVDTAATVDSVPSVTDEGGGWYRAVLLLDAEQTLIEIGDPLLSVALTLVDGAGTSRDYFWGGQVAFDDTGTLTAPPAIESSPGDFRFLTLADSTLLLNTRWPTRVIDNPGDTLETWASKLVAAPQNDVRIDVLLGLQTGTPQTIVWTVITTGGTHTGTVPLVTPRHYARGPIRDDILASVLAESPIFAASLPLGERTLLVKSTEEILSVTTTAFFTSSLLLSAADRLLISIEVGSVSNYSWSITNTSGTFAGVYASVTTDKAVIAAGIASQIALVDASLALTVSQDNVVSVNSATDITASSVTSATMQSRDDYVKDIAYMFIKQGVDGAKYTWSVGTGDGTVGGTYIATGVTDTATIANAIATQIALSSLTLQGTISEGAIIEVRSYADITDSTLKDDSADTLVSAFRDEVDSLSDLPVNFREGYRIKVSADPSTEIDDHYAVFSQTTPGTGMSTGVWKESADWGAESAYAGHSMPQQISLAHDDDAGSVTGTPGAVYFLYSRAPWVAREVGADGINDAASFRGKTISDILFHANRLGFLSDQNMILSEAGVFFNFWDTTMLTVPVSDRIDIASNETQLSTLQTHGQIGGELIVSSPSNQFVLRGEPITPSSAVLSRVSSFATANIVPGSLGNSLAFLSSPPDFTAAFEFFRVNASPGARTQGAGLLASEEVSQPVPHYIVGTPEFLISSSRDSAYFIKAGPDNILYVFRTSFSGQQRIMASWGRWIFPTDTRVLHVGFTSTLMVLVMKRQGELFLETMRLGDGLLDAGQQLVVHLDRRVRDTSLAPVYSALNDDTTLTLPYTLSGGSTPAVTTLGGLEIPVKSSTATTITVFGDYSTTSLWAGELYSQSIILTEPIVQQQGQSGPTPIFGRFQIQTLEVAVQDTGDFKIRTTPRGSSETFEHEFTAQRVNTFDSSVGSIVLQSGLARTSILSPAEGITVELFNDSPLPSRFLSLVWRGDRNSRPPSL